MRRTGETSNVRDPIDVLPEDGYARWFEKTRRASDAWKREQASKKKGK